MCVCVSVSVSVSVSVYGQLFAGGGSWELGVEWALLPQVRRLISFCPELELGPESLPLTRGPWI